MVNRRLFAFREGFFVGIEATRGMVEGHYFYSYFRAPEKARENIDQKQIPLSSLSYGL